MKLRAILQRFDKVFQYVVGASTISSFVLLLMCGAGATDIGTTLTHLSADCPLNSASKSTELGIAAADNIILNYDKPDVRSSARRMMAELRDSGANALRTFVWFRHSEDARLQKLAFADRVGVALATSGRLSEGVLANLRAYIQDARSAGFRKLYLVTGPRASAGPRCRKVSYGDCFDPSLLPLSWSVTRQLVLTARALEGPNFEVIPDIAPEMCSASLRYSPARNENISYISYMLTHWKNDFGPTGFIVSCIAKPI